VNSETMLTLLHDEEALESFEAAFLCSESSLRASSSDMLLLPVAGTYPRGSAGRVVTADEPLRPTVRTSNVRCC
jgi:hypothetical protein